MQFHMSSSHYEIMKLSQWAKKHGYSYNGAWLKFKRGGLPGARQLPDGTILVEEEVNKDERPDCWAIYARVSSAEQRSTNLEYQAKRLTTLLKKKGCPVGYVVKEVGSGLNDKRPKLLALLRRSDVTHIVVEHKDRLTRFGFEYLKVAAEAKGIQLVVVNKVDDDRQDLVQDFVSLVTSFCARLYGQRRTKRATEKLIEGLNSENGDSRRTTSNKKKSSAVPCSRRSRTAK